MQVENRRLRRTAQLQGNSLLNTSLLCQRLSLLMQSFLSVFAQLSRDVQHRLRIFMSGEELLCNEDPFGDKA